MRLVVCTRGHARRSRSPDGPAPRAEHGRTPPRPLAATLNLLTHLALLPWTPPLVNLALALRACRSCSRHETPSPALNRRVGGAVAGENAGDPRRGQPFQSGATSRNAGGSRGCATRPGRARRPSLKDSRRGEGLRRDSAALGILLAWRAAAAPAAAAASSTRRQRPGRRVGHHRRIGPPAQLGDVEQRRQPPGLHAGSDASGPSTFVDGSVTLPPQLRGLPRTGGYALG